MTWTLLDTQIVIIGGLCAMSAALLGNFLVLRRMSMMGDAISHAVLPGLALAFLITGSRASSVMLIGAGVVGVLTAALTQAVHRSGGVDQGASMGVVFTTLFAIASPPRNHFSVTIASSSPTTAWKIFPKRPPRRVATQSTTLTCATKVACCPTLRSPTVETSRRSS